MILLRDNSTNIPPLTGLGIGLAGCCFYKYFAPDGAARFPRVDGNTHGYLNAARDWRMVLLGAGLQICHPFTSSERHFL